jgi:hypothetical protein
MLKYGYVSNLLMNEYLLVLSGRVIQKKTCVMNFTIMTNLKREKKHFNKLRINDEQSRSFTSDITS